MDESRLETRASADGFDPEALQGWGPFRDLQRVGRGSFGEVYRAFDPTLQRHVALKLLLPRDSNRADEANAVLREARAMARLRHPNVLPIYGVDRHEGRVGFWSDFVQGRTLSELVAAQGGFGAREAALVGIDVCRAVGAVHAAGLVHRDIKAGNVMREDGGRILLMDFGLTLEPGTSDTGDGTPLYMAPELLEGRPATVASDLYAIGVLLFNLLTKAYPVNGSNVGALRAAHASGVRGRLLDLRPELSDALALVVETAIHPAPEKRFATTGQMAVALTEAIGLGSGRATVEPERASRRSPRVWVLLLLAAVSVAVVFLSPSVGRLVAPLRVSETPIAGSQGDYQRARDLLAHYYRPSALESAIPLLERVVAQDGQFAPAFADLARANLLQFVQQRDTKYIEPARLSATRALSLAPDLASPHVTLGALYARTSQNELARHELDEAIRLDRFNAPAYAALADLYARQGRIELVQPTLQKAVDLAPRDWSVLQQLGEHYLDSGKCAEAGAQYRRAVELAPDNSRAHNNLGLVYRCLDQLEESAAAFQTAINIEPTFLRYRNLGMVLAEAGNYSAALPMLERSIEMRPEQYRAWGLLGFLHLNRAEMAESRAKFLKAISLASDLLKQTPRDEYLLADVGGYYAALGMDQEARPLLAQAASLAPAIPEVLYQVAVGYAMMDRRDDALRLLVEARALGLPASAIARNPQLRAIRVVAGSPR